MLARLKYWVSTFNNACKAENPASTPNDLEKPQVKRSHAYLHRGDKKQQEQLVSVWIVVSMDNIT